MLTLISYARSFLRSTFLIGALLSLTCGCALTVPTVQDRSENQETTDGKPAPAEEIWRQVASAVSRRSITRTTQLAQIVLALVKNGDFSDADAAKFDAAFPSVTNRERDLTDADAELLRSLK